MSDPSNEPFVELTLAALLETDPLPQSLAVRVCVHDELHTAAAGEGDVDITLRYDPYAPPLGPDAEWQSFEPLPIAPFVLRDGAEPRPLLGDPTNRSTGPVDPADRSVRPVHPAPSIASQDFWFAPREAQEFDAESMLATEKAAIAIVFDTSLELTEIPIMGGKLPPELGIGLRGFALVWTPAGMALRPELWIRNKPFTLPLLMLSDGDSFDTGGSSGTSTSPSAIRPVYWMNVKKALGPLDLHRLGLGFGDSKLWLLMDASLQLGPVTLTALGLGMGIHLGKLLSGELTLPAFHIDGLGVQVRTASGVTVGGALLRSSHAEMINGKTVEYDRYAGAMIVQTNGISFSALGLFQAPPGKDPSLFAYGTRNQPLGGPPFFFVTQLSLGFGLNMRFTLPDVANAHRFPLVREAKSPSLPRTPNLADLIRVAGDLQEYQENAPGNVVLALGMVATSFGLINSSLVLIATIGNSLEVDLVGQSVLQLPADVTSERIADIRVNWRGHWSTTSDKISIRGQVQKGSWAFHRRFKLTGQMAFEAWTQGPHAGDFVFTVGGYAPSFRKPSHYPSAARLAMGWTEKVGDLKLSVKGEGYCAITPSALMIGGALSYSLTCGDFDAWYKLAAHFLLSWYPFRYSAKLSVEIGASYTIEVDLLFTSFSLTLTVEVGADVEIWGPDLGGKVTFNLLDFIDVSFTFGDSNTTSPSLTWTDFKKGFLGKEQLALALRATRGMRGEIDDAAGAIWVVSAEELTIELESPVPAKTITAWSQTLTGPSFGVRPMKLNAVVTSDINVVVTDKDGITVPCAIEPSLRNMPAAQWGPSGLPQQQRLVTGLLTGVSVSNFGGSVATPLSLQVPVPDAMINWDKHPQCPEAWRPTLGATANQTGDYATLWNGAALTPIRTALLRELFDLGADEPSPIDELRSAWIGELQKTPTLKTKMVA